MHKKLMTITCALAMLLPVGVQGQSAQGSSSTTSAAENPDSPQYQEVKRLGAAADVMDAIMAAPDKGIPEEVLGSAKCIAVIPSMLNAGFVFGGRYGKGVATCRTDKGWSAPAPVRIEGGSWGLQIGGQAIDLVMVIMNDNGMNSLLSSKFKIGADVSAAAGPVGRHAAADTDWKMRAEVLNYSRARGLFAGITLNGAVIKQDQDDTRDLYGRMVPFRTILRGNIATPAGAERFVNTIAKYVPATGTTNAAKKEGSSTSAAPATAAEPASTAAETAKPSAPAAQPATAAGPGPTTPSETVKSEIESKLRAEPTFDASKVQVTVTQDEVELAGTVPTNSDRDTAIRIANENAAGRRVADRLSVAADAAPATTQTQDQPK